MGPFEHLDQEERSEDNIKRFSGPLIQEAREILAVRPGAELVALILEHGTHEYKRVRTKLEQRTGHEDVVAGFAGVMSPEEAAETFDPKIRADLVRWIAKIHAETTGALPVVVCTKDGLRVGVYGLGTLDDTGTSA